MFIALFLFAALVLLLLFLAAPSEMLQMIGAVILLIIVFAVVEAASFGLVAGVFWLICWAFGLTIFSWKIAFGIWLVLEVVIAIGRAIFKRGDK